MTALVLRTEAQQLLSRHRTAATVAGNLGLAFVAYLGAFLLRFDLAPSWRHWGVLLSTLPLLFCCKGLAFWATGLFHDWWRHLGPRDLETIVKGNVLASIAFMVAVVLGPGVAGFPRAVFLIDLILAVSLMTGARVTFRMVRERKERPMLRRIETLALVVGAGSAGIRLVEEIERRPRLTLAVVGFVDDDPAKAGLRVGGVPVLGNIDDLPALVARHAIGEVLIALPAAPGALLRRIVRRCEEAHVRHRVLPSLTELVDGRFMYTQMREVKVADLLARAPIQLDMPRVRSFITGRTVLVSGAAGSIGSELCRQIAAQGVGRIILYDRHENGVFTLESELAARFPNVPVEPVLGDVLLEDQLAAVFETYHPEVVLHAAAFKHLPMAERNALEVVRNNIVGTCNIAHAATAYGAKEFVLVSSDKAVRPTSVMGVSKRVAELVVQNLQGSQCRFVAVRFGNVLGSSGSVVPLFRDQIARGGPVTVTHPEATRYFMTIPEAAALILQAATLGDGGDVFLLEMGDAVRILDLARQMIRLSGFEPDEDIAISFTGLRPGEKLHEELIAEDEEEVRQTHHERIKVLGGGRPRPELNEWLTRLQAALRARDLTETLRLIQFLVPSYRPSELLADGSASESATNAA